MPGLWIDRLVPVTVRIHQAICRGPQTAAVLQAYEGGGQEGFRECRRAQERSGVELPDLPGPRLWFAWGPVMGEGAGAFVSVAAAERRSAWARSRGEARRTLVDPVLPRLAGRPLPPVPVPTGAAHGPCDRRWRWRARLGERTGTPPADLWARVLAGAGGRQLEPLGPVVLYRRRPRLRG
jgi:hypothetical protein